MCLHNAALVVDDDDCIRGIVTSKCALQAVAENASLDCSVATWLQNRRDCSIEGPREVAPDTRLIDAADIMMTNCVHHLVVTEPMGYSPIGVFSSLDLVRSIVSASLRCPFESMGRLSVSKQQATQPA